MMRNRIEQHITAYCLLTLLLFGCTKAELRWHPKEKTGDVTLNINWQGHVAPKVLRVYFYNVAGDETIEQDCTDLSKLTATLPEGTYRIITVNTDVAGVGFRGMDKFETAQAYLLPPSKARTKADETAGGLFIAHLDNISVSSKEEVLCDIAPIPAIKGIQLNLNFGQNVIYVKTCSAVLEGVSTSVNLATGIPEKGVNERISVALHENEFIYQGFTHLMGNDTENPSILELELTFEDGSTQTIRLDIEDSMELINEAGVLNVDIEMKMVESGFQIAITDWSLEENDMEISRPK